MDRLTYGQTDRHGKIDKGGQTNGSTFRQTDTETDRWTDRQMDRLTDRRATD